jgi:uncharacterized protein (TIGR00290 family)
VESQHHLTLSNKRWFVKKKVVLSWSSGKDSAWALQLLRSNPGFEVVALFTTLNQSFDRVVMHAVRRSLLELQALAIGLPLHTAFLPWPCSNQEYEVIMSRICSQYKRDGVEAVAFGDLFLQEVRDYRESQLRGTGLEPIFPLWRIPTHELAREMIVNGLRARLTCVDPRLLPGGFVGREFDLQLLAELPPQVDPCGENGEFHSFAYAGPMFTHPVSITSGETLERDSYFFTDLLPGESGN